MGSGHLGWLSSVGVRGKAKRMGGGHIRMGGGHLGWLSSVGVQGKAKQMGGGRRIVFEWVVAVEHWGVR